MTTPIDVVVFELQQNRFSSNAEPIIAVNADFVTMLEYIESQFASGDITVINGTANQIDASRVGTTVTLSLDPNVQIATSLAIGGIAIGSNALAVQGGTIDFSPPDITVTSGTPNAGVTMIQNFNPGGASTAVYTGAVFQTNYNANFDTSGQEAALKGVNLHVGGHANQQAAIVGLADYQGSLSDGGTSSLYSALFTARQTGTGSTGHLFVVKITQPTNNGTLTESGGLYIANQIPLGTGSVTQMSPAIVIEGAGDATGDNAIAFSGVGGSVGNHFIYAPDANNLDINPKTTLNISPGNATITSGASFGVAVTQNVNPGGASTAAYTGSAFQTNYISASNTTGQDATVKITNIHTSVAGHANQQVGLSILSDYQGALSDGGTGTIIGLLCNARNSGSGSTTFVFGAQFTRPVNGGTINRIAGIYISNQVPAAGTVTVASMALFVEGTGDATGDNAIAFSGDGSTNVNHLIYANDANNLHIKPHTTLNLDGTVIATNGLTVGSTTLLTSNVGLTNNAAAQVATLTNGPTAGNPTKWIPINDNGVTRNIPAW